MRTKSSWLWLGVWALSACAGSGAKHEQPTVPAPSAVAPPTATTGAVGAPALPVAQGKPRGDLIPRNVLFGNPERADARVSPDGKFLSWLAASNGVLNVWVAPIDKLSEARPVTADKTRPVREYFWAFDGKHLLYLQDVGGDENFHLFRSDVASGEVKELTPIAGARVEVTGLSERKPNVVLVGINDRDPQVFDLHRIDIATGERALVAQNDQGFVGYHADGDLNVRFAERMAPDGSSLVFAFDEKSKQWAEYDTIPATDTLGTTILGFDRKGTGYYALDSRERDTSALFLVDAKSKKKKLLFEDARVDMGEVLTHPKTHAIEAVVVNFDRPRWVALDKKLQKDLDALAKLAGDDGFPFVTARTLDDKVWTVVVDSDHASPKYYRWDRATQRGEFLFSARPALDGQPLARMNPEVIRSRDALDLVSYLSLPHGSDANDDRRPDKPLPMVLLVHGGPWGRDEWGYNSLHQLLTNRGYAVLSVNFRASTGFGKRFANAGDKQWGKKMHDDLLDAVAWAVTNKVAPKDQICIMGGSYGGYATLVGVSMTPEVFSCGVDIVGPSSIVTLLETIPPYWAPMLAMFHARVGNPTTDEGKRELLAVSPLLHAAKIKKPLLIAQGANDPRVKKSESDQIVRAMQEKRVPVSYVVFPDEGHGFARPENKVAFYAVTEAFLSVHLGGFFQPISEQELGASSLAVEAGRESLPGLPTRSAEARP